MKRLSFLCISILTLIHGKAFGEGNSHLPECKVNGIDSAKYGWMPEFNGHVISLRKKIADTNNDIVFSASYPLSDTEETKKILVVDSTVPNQPEYPERITVKSGKNVLCYGDNRNTDGHLKPPECIFGVNNPLIYDDETNDNNKTVPTRGNVNLDIYDGIRSKHLLLDMNEIDKALSETASEVDKMTKSKNEKKCHESSKEGCYITTAVCEHVGLQDNCFELTQLRRFRDEYLLSFTDGANDVEKYYEIAPLINHAISPTKYITLYWRYILPCAISSFLRMNKFTHARYKKMVSELALNISTLPVTL